MATEIVSRWRAFEATVRDRGLDWALHYAPAGLRWARTTHHLRGEHVDHLLPADYLDLEWVEEQSGSPYSYGLIDTQDGRWRIPLGKQFISVRPFRGGVAEVIPNTAGSNYSGPWRRIDASGRLLDDGEPADRAAWISDLGHRDNRPPACRLITPLFVPLNP
ncbi:MAG TPA: hypothetical protein VGX23_26690 [Actinocrinis sp.]|nr:hypothetical protein [Actinocrinis sp.]